MRSNTGRTTSLVTVASPAVRDRTAPTAAA
jgi:hypothetical protein